MTTKQTIYNSFSKIVLTIILLIIISGNSIAFAQKKKAPNTIIPLTITNEIQSIKVNNTKIDTLKIAILLPLYYDYINQLNFNKYNIAQTRKIDYKCFKYLSFYEGLRLGAENFTKTNKPISLYVFDVLPSDSKSLSQALSYPEIKDMNLIIPYQIGENIKMAEHFCSVNSIACLSTIANNTIKSDYQYIYNYSLNPIAKCRTLIRWLSQKHKNENIVVLYDPSTPKQIIELLKTSLPNITDSWPILNYKQSANSLKKYISSKSKTVVVSLVNQPSDNDNKQYCKGLIERLLSFKQDITLVSEEKWIDFLPNEYDKLQSLDFHFLSSSYMDYTNKSLVEFINSYRDNFAICPDKQALLGYDIINNIVPLLLNNNNQINKSINRAHFFGYCFDKDDSKISYYQNEGASIYKIKDYKIELEWIY